MRGGFRQSRDRVSELFNQNVRVNGTGEIFKVACIDTNTQQVARLEHEDAPLEWIDVDKVTYVK
jgi:hypothetical protein